MAALALFAQKLAADWPLGLAANSLWLCHLGNLAMGLGLMFNAPRVACVGVLWLAPGAPVWLMDAWLTKTTTLPSVLSHVGGLAVACWAWHVWRHWHPQRTDWFVAWLAFLAAQQAARAWAPPHLNVNLAHAIYPGAEAWFASYTLYAMAVAIIAALIFALTQHVLAWPGERRKRTPSQTSSLDAGATR